jgi:hypothetical protein
MVLLAERNHVLLAVLVVLPLRRLTLVRQPQQQSVRSARVLQVHQPQPRNVKHVRVLQVHLLRLPSVRSVQQLMVLLAVHSLVLSAVLVVVLKM